MKAKVIFAAIAAVAMLMPGTAVAQRGQRHDMGRKMHRMERRFDDRHHGSRVLVAHRPSIGARIAHRPAIGRFITLNRERLWLADGVLYRVVRSGNSIIYIVVGYI